jgi:hypothetical protein
MSNCSREVLKMLINIEDKLSICRAGKMFEQTNDNITKLTNEIIPTYLDSVDFITTINKCINENMQSGYFSGTCSIKLPIWTYNTIIPNFILFKDNIKQILTNYYLLNYQIDINICKTNEYHYNEIEYIKCVIDISWNI